MLASKRNVFSHLIGRLKKEGSSYSEYSKLSLHKIWFVHTSNENSEPGKLSYITHFDKSRYLKLMLYIDRVLKIDKPFITAYVNVNQNEAARLKLNKSSTEENSVNEKLSYKQIMLNAADGIIFDTNCPHLACPVEKNGERRVIRVDF